MTKMIPDSINPDTKSNAEIKLFDAIKRSLNGNWICLHSLSLMSDAKRKPWTEIDFVLIGPDGIFCLEVKGGRVRKEGGLWIFTDGRGQEFKRYKGPFDQASDASFELRSHLIEALGSTGLPLFGFGVMTPDIVFSPRTPEAEQEVIYDQNDDGSFDRYIGRLIRYWSSKFSGIPNCSEKKISEIVNFLRGDFDLRPNLSFRIKQVEQEIIQLTGQQKLAFSGMRDNPRVVVRGSAGTGKTLCAIEEAKNLAASGKSVLLCCFNRRLAHALRKATSGLENIKCIHIHGLMSELVKEAKLDDSLRNGDSDGIENLFSEEYPALSLEAIDLLGKHESYDALIIDEGQDLLTENFLDVLEYLLKGGIRQGNWRVFLDDKQDIFGALDQRLLNRLEAEAGSAKFSLTINCRNTKPIAVMTGILADVPIERILAASGPDVDTDWYDNRQDARRKISRLINRFLSDGIEPSNIVVLSDRRMAGSSVSNGLVDVSFELVEPDPESELTDNQIGYFTIQSFKGLESEVVVLIDLDDITAIRSLANNYVGSSRATSKLAVYISRSAKDEYQELSIRYGERLIEADSSVFHE